MALVALIVSKGHQHIPLLGCPGSCNAGKCMYRTAIVSFYELHHVYLHDHLVANPLCQGLLDVGYQVGVSGVGLTHNAALACGQEHEGVTNTSLLVAVVAQHTDELSLSPHNQLVHLVALRPIHVDEPDAAELGVAQQGKFVQGAGNRVNRQC